MFGQGNLLSRFQTRRAIRGLLATGKMDGETTSALNLALSAPAAQLDEVGQSLDDVLAAAGVSTAPDAPGPIIAAIQTLIVSFINNPQLLAAWVQVILNIFHPTPTPTPAVPTAPAEPAPNP